MAIADGLEKLPKELLEPSEKIISVLDDSKKNHRLHGLNISQLSDKTELSKYALNKVLGALETLGIVEYESQGTSKVYYLIKEEEV